MGLDEQVNEDGVIQESQEFPKPIYIPPKLLEGSKFLDALDWSRRFMGQCGGSDYSHLLRPMRCSI